MAKIETSLITRLIEIGVQKKEAKHLASFLETRPDAATAEARWQRALAYMQSASHVHAVVKLMYEHIYPTWQQIPAPVYFPDANAIQSTHLAELMHAQHCEDYDSLHNWSIEHYPQFWQLIIERLKIHVDHPFRTIVDTSKGLSAPRWLVDAKLNIVNSCLPENSKAAAKTAIITQDENGHLCKITYGELTILVNRIANRIRENFKPKDRIAIIMPMTVQAIAAYLGIIKAGCCAVTIPDSFSAKEIAQRLHITRSKAVFTQDYAFINNKRWPLYEKIIDANVGQAIVYADSSQKPNIRKQDILWDDFLSANTQCSAYAADPDEHITILFSSGTTSKPKAIPWHHTTPIKCASDAYLYQDVHANDIICWPTNIGWMMGLWTLYAAFINHATLAIYQDSPKHREFGKFLQNAQVTMLGVVPTLVRAWRQSDCMAGLNWQSITRFSSSGECANIDDMFYLMSLAGYRPIIEYCGGSEIGGAYVTGTMIHPSAPAAFNVQTLGLSFQILDEHKQATDQGEVALIPPAIGLSTELLNKNHHQVYYARMPHYKNLLPMRRHGDQIKRFSNGFYRLLGRMDDAMNLSGIKVSAAEIEHVLNNLPNVRETAAIACIPPHGGPSQLVIYVRLIDPIAVDMTQLKKTMQEALKNDINRAFRVHDVVSVDHIPKTSSHKIMRRVLRERYDVENNSLKISRPVNTNKPHKLCLALQGGGAYGAYTWGILDKFLEDGRIEIDAISATSAGSVNAVVLADGLLKGGIPGAREALRDFWETLSQYGTFLSPIRQTFPYAGTNLDLDVFSQASFVMMDILTRNLSPYILNPLNLDLLKLILIEKVDFKKIRTQNKIKLYISATNVKSGMLHIFENAELSVEAVLASACLPHLSQAVKIDNQYYWDGGFLGNPAIYPLIYHSSVDDILIIHNNPIMRDSLPITSTDIDSRVNELSFNSSLLRELRAIAFITKLIDKGWIKDQYKEQLRRKYLHMIRSDDVMNQFYLINKYNWHWSFIRHLRDLGRDTAAAWLKNNFQYLGKKQTIDFNEFLGKDTQSTS